MATEDTPTTRQRNALRAAADADGASVADFSKEGAGDGTIAVLLGNGWIEEFLSPGGYKRWKITEEGNAARLRKPEKMPKRPKLAPMKPRLTPAPSILEARRNRKA
ncbi:MAG: hypothetical protein CML23_15830 [Rhizobiaceae bacterium]|nr:hypothetical protein [Rhizobiaceae bacterium]|tara:strand:+ start:459 stop:776 length:318 start_codon:yes stop_codon:yes gene_type:complete